MKKLVFSLAILATIFTGCTSDDDEGTATPIATGEINGDITTTKELPLGNYTLRGTVKVKNGASLRIAAGSVITSDVTNGPDALLIENGGKLFLEGTAALPIVFTEISQMPGSWGGIIMYGDAPIVGANGVVSATSEDGNALTYGGSNPTHNGGILRYVRVEFAGKKLTDNTSEMNGFSFYSVGSGTILENLVSYKGADDGFEFYGGTVSGQNLISYGNYDDSFDWQDGWRGQNNTNWYAYQVNTGNFGMEIEAKSVNNAFWPVISNITLKRASGTATEGGSSAAEYDAIQFKKEGNGDFSNILISGYTTAGATAVRIQDAATNTNQVNASKIKLTNVKINDGTSESGGVGTFTVAFPTGQYTTGTTATGANITSGAWSIVNGSSLIQ
ncbi:MAG: hypothetical protein V4648_04205 [Bacteroidota bacterium]